MAGWNSGAPVLGAPSFSPSAIKGVGFVELASILSFCRGEELMKHVEVVRLLAQYMTHIEHSVSVCGMNKFKRRRE